METWEFLFIASLFLHLSVEFRFNRLTWYELYIAYNLDLFASETYEIIRTKLACTEIEIYLSTRVENYKSSAIVRDNTFEIIRPTIKTYREDNFKYETNFILHVLVN